MAPWIASHWFRSIILIVYPLSHSGRRSAKVPTIMRRVSWTAFCGDISPAPRLPTFNKFENARLFQSGEQAPSSQPSAVCRGRFSSLDTHVRLPVDRRAAEVAVRSSIKRYVKAGRVTFSAWSVKKSGVVGGYCCFLVYDRLTTSSGQNRVDGENITQVRKNTYGKG